MNAGGGVGGKEAEEEREGERERIPAWSPTRSSILRHRDHDLSQNLDA